MKECNVLQIGQPREVYETPNCKFVAELIGISNFLRGTVAAREGRCVDTVAGRVRLESSARAPVGEEVVAAVRPECIEISTTGWGNRVNEWPRTVTNRAFLGEAIDHVVRVGQGSLRVRGNPSVSIKPGLEIFVATEPSKVTLVPVG